MSLDQAPGWYGKLSTLGDFASRRLAPEAVRTLDTWLAAAVHGSQSQLGDAWLPAYLGSPLQRFMLGPGVLDTSWWCGVLMPSCDKVGRYFPLVVLQPRLGPPADRFALDHLELWWQRAGEAALETLSENVDVERFERALAELPPWPALRDSGAWAAAAVGDVDEASECTVPAGCSLVELALALSTTAWVQRLQGRSAWWSWRPQDGASACRIVTGWPTAECFTAMLGAAA